LTTGSSKVDEGYSRCLKAISTLVHETSTLCAPWRALIFLANLPSGIAFICNRLFFICFFPYTTIV